MALNIWHLSDLHLNYNLRRMGASPAIGEVLSIVRDRKISLARIQKLTGRRPDVIVLAGDISGGLAGIEWAGHLREKFRLPVLYVPGNHEPYGENLNEHRTAMQEAAQACDVTLLDDAWTEIAGIRFIGSTLWTDFRICGEAEMPWAIRDATTYINDYRFIEVRDFDGRERTLMPADTIALHEASLAFLDATLGAGLPSVVVTHHLPHPESIAPRFKSSRTNGAFCSNLEDLILRHQPLLWIHGHTHDTMAYSVGRTRIVCNPMGYGDENNLFDPFRIETIHA